MDYLITGIIARKVKARCICNLFPLNVTQRGPIWSKVGKELQNYHSEPWEEVSHVGKQVQRPEKQHLRTPAIHFHFVSKLFVLVFLSNLSEAGSFLAIMLMPQQLSLLSDYSLS